MQTNPPLPSGALLKEPGCVHSAVLGGWVIDRRTDAPLLVTVAHVLKPRPELFSRHSAAPPTPAVLEPADAYLGNAIDPLPLAQVLRMGVAVVRRAEPSLDVAVAAPLSETLAPCDGLFSAYVLPQVGQSVVLACSPQAFEAGTVIATGWRSGHYGARTDILVKPRDGEAFSQPGMSGAWVLEEVSGLPVGMLVGDIAGEYLCVSGLAGIRIACLHPIACILDLFELTLD